MVKSLVEVERIDEFVRRETVVQEEELGQEQENTSDYSWPRTVRLHERTFSLKSDERFPI